MNRHRQPPSDAVVLELVRAGISLPTALAMERNKAVEILELLRVESLTPPPVLSTTPTRGTI
jgi:hypothetical protein